MSLRPLPPDDNGRAWLVNAGQVINANNLLAGTGITITKTAQGVIISTTADRKPNYAYNAGGYSFDAEYFPGAIVYVDPTKTYLDQNGAPLTISAGGYICINHVPSSANTSTLFLSNVVPAISNAGGNATDIEANTFRWYSQNTYYPNTNTATASSTTGVSGYDIYTSQSFWMPIGGAGASITWKQWNYTASYNPGDLVWVEPNAGYPIPWTSTSGSTAPLTAGSFLVVQPVPASGSARNSYNWYWPIYPVWPDSAMTSASLGSGSTVPANQIFFRPVNPITLIGGCMNDQTVTNAFGAFWFSGSNGGYQYSLPYGG